MFLNLWTLLVLGVSTLHVQLTNCSPIDADFASEDKDGVLVEDRGDSVLVEGDMLISQKQYRDLYDSSNAGSIKRLGKRGFATVDPFYRWPNAEIPYLVDMGDFAPGDQYNLHRSMTEWERYTCIRWRPKETNDRYWVNIVGNSGCLSWVGRRNKRAGQTLWLGAACRDPIFRTIHEMGHTIGLEHEHIRQDRDRYVIVNPLAFVNMSDNYKKAADRKESFLDSLGTPYDFKSIMHYGSNSNTFNGGKPAITPREKSNAKWIENSISEWGRSLSFWDVKIVNMMYNCSDHCSAADKNKCTGIGFLDQNCNCICEDGTTDCDRTKRRQRSSCSNKFEDNWRCNYWANTGECERNPKWMGRECAKACGLCTSGGSTAQSRCKNVYSDTKCDVWKRRGDCVTNREWMRRNCPRSCDLCRDDRNRPDANCENKNQVSTLCDDFAKDGDCLKRPRSMHTHCRKSCFQCHLRMSDVDKSWSVVNDTIQEEEIPCEDRDRWTDCFRAYYDGICSSTYCRKTCGKCEDGTCKNLAGDAACMEREKGFECIGNSVWMARHCALACGRRQCAGVTATARPPSVRTTHLPIPPEHCTNTQEVCESFAAEGRCDNDVNNWMRLKCPKACGFCGGYQRVTSTPKPKVTRPACRNNNFYECPDWIKKGKDLGQDYCKMYPDYAWGSCRKACKLC